MAALELQISSDRAATLIQRIFFTYARLQKGYGFGQVGSECVV